MDQSTAAPGRLERALLVGSSGGHLTQLLALEPWWREIERGWVTFDTPDAVHALAGEEHVWWAAHPTTRNVPNLLRNTRLAWRLVREFAVLMGGSVDVSSAPGEGSTFRVTLPTTAEASPPGATMLPGR